MFRSVSKESDCCSSSEAIGSVSAELKLYQAFIFSVPAFFTLILLFLFYLFYLRRRRVDWSSLRMRSSIQNNNDLSRVEMGVKKELREMLPIMVYKESFSIKDSQCSVCLGDYQAEDKLQQIPACGHTFHMVCIDSWLANHSTCPLCRLSVLASPKAHKSSNELPEVEATNSHESSNPENNNGSSIQQRSNSWEEAEAAQPIQPTNVDARNFQNSGREDERSS